MVEKSKQQLKVLIVTDRLPLTAGTTSVYALLFIVGVLGEQYVSSRVGLMCGLRCFSCSGDGGRQQHIWVFHNTFITTICPTGGRYYSQLGAYSQTEHLTSLVIDNTLYKSILFSLCIMNPKYVCFLQKPKTNCPNACPRIISPPKPRENPWQRTSTPRQQPPRQTSLEANWSGATLP